MVQASTAPLAVFSFGGGVQSTAALVLAAQGKLDCKTFLFCNVGDDSENPGTLRYVREVAMPYAAAHGLTIETLQRRRKTGEVETLYGRLTKPNSRSFGIPVRLSGSGTPANRSCTGDFKIQQVANWCWKHGARAKHPATTMLGISMDEFQRMRNTSGYSYTRLAYPLIDRRMSRQDCMNVIARSGLPIPPKSSCWFCPYHRLSDWQRMSEREPELFSRAVALEAMLTARAKIIKGKASEAVYFSSRMRPLPMLIGDASQPSLFENDACESGYCMV